jgi:hypothetical protein
MGLTRALVDRVRTLRYEEIPEDAREIGRQCLLDLRAKFDALAGPRLGRAAGERARRGSAPRRSPVVDPRPDSRAHGIS